MTSPSKSLTEPGQVQLFWLSDTNISLVCEKLLDCIPGKYWTYLGHWGEQPVIAKFFADQQAAEQELIGTQMLTESNIATRELLYHGWVNKRSLYVFLYAPIQPKYDFELSWQLADEKTRLNLLNELILITAQLHQIGLSQNSLKSFLLHHEKVYVVSSEDIVKSKNKIPLSKHLSLKNLGMLLAQFPPQYDALSLQHYLAYTKARSIVFTATSTSRLKKWIVYWRKHRLITCGKTSFQSSAQLVCDKNWKHFFVCNRGYDTKAMRDLLKNPDQILQHPDTEILKNDQTSTVAKVLLDGRVIIIKRHNAKSLWHAFRRAFIPSRAAINWRNAHYLNLLNITTAKPIAMLEKRWGFLRGASYFISEYIVADHLKNFFATTYTSEQLVLIAKNISQLFADLDSVQLAHGDMKATNILLIGYKPALLDLDAMYLYRTYWRWQRAARGDQQRFMKNWENQPELQNVFREKLKNRVVA